ncbi:MAG: hypothetical protein M3N43_06520 [Actinomycetota bacterium]|nr:hypothetical protein [Actinomycetota bacterium]
MSNANANPWDDPRYQTRYHKWDAPGTEIDGFLIGWEQGEFPATAEAPAKPYAIAILETKHGEKELALSLVDLKDQVFAARPAVGDHVYARYIRDVEKKKIFEVKVTRATQAPVAEKPATEIPF